LIGAHSETHGIIGGAPFGAVPDYIDPDPQTR